MPARRARFRARTGIGPRRSGDYIRRVLSGRAREPARPPESGPRRCSGAPPRSAPEPTRGARTEQPRDDLGAVLRRGVLQRALLQRFVMTRATPLGWRYSSSWEPRTLHDTPQAAAASDALLEQRSVALAVFVANARSPTLYTYTNTAVTSQITGTPQGPHTAPHAHVSHALGQLAGRESLLAAFYEQAPWPEQVVRMLCTETGCQPAALDMAYQRFLRDYEALYGATERALWNAAVPVAFLQTAIGAMLDMNPYSTYAWKSGRAASKRSTKGKGERLTVPFRQAVDTRARFADRAAYERFLDDRERLVEGEYEYEEGEPGEEEIEEGIYDMDGLLLTVEAKQVGDTVSIWPSGEWIIEALRTDGATVVGVRLRRPA